MTRILPLVCGLAVIAGVSSASTDKGAYRPLRFNGDQISVVIHKGAGGGILVVGDNPLDDPRP